MKNGRLKSWLSNRWLLSMLACLLAVGNAWPLRADTKSLRELRRAAEANAEQAQAVAEQSRLSLIKLALEIRAKEVAAARGEAERLKLEKQRVSLRVETRRWTLGSFEAAQRKITTGTRYSSKYLDGLQRAQDLARRRQVEFPEQERLAVKSGTALNSMLQACGDVAVQNASMRALLEDRLQSENLSNEQRQDFNELLRTLEWIHGPDSITDRHRQQLRFKSGSGLSALIIEARNAKDAALPLNWPVVFRSDSEFAPHMQTLAQAKKQALSDLEAGRPIDWQLAAEPMLTAADRIRERVAAQYLEYCKNGPYNAFRHRELTDARSFALSLRTGVYRFIQARELIDVRPSEPLSARTVEDLLAYMRRQGYSFAEADVNSESTHFHIYMQLVEYYQRWRGLQLSQDSDERELAELQGKLNRVFDMGYGGNAMKELEAVLRAKPERDLLDVVQQLSEIAANTTEVVKNLQEKSQE